MGMTDCVIRLEIRGRVQGVGYRWSMAKVALELGLSGWVRNRLDGSVDVTVAGPQDQVERLVAWARRGPVTAQVDTVDRFEATGHFAGFEQLPTV